MNYLIMDQMKEYEAEFDSMLFHLPLADLHLKKFIMIKQWQEQYQSLYQQMN
jgi:hypothetical protein